MDWATRRRRTVIALFVSVALATFAIISFAIFYEVPTCIDRMQNQGEEGIDCGGPCSSVCTANAKIATVRFARALSQSGRTDVIAYIDNPNQDAAALGTKMVIELYTADGQIKKTNVVVDIPAGRTTPVYIPNVATGESVVRQTFLQFADGYPRWERASSTLPVATAQGIQAEEGERPRVSATLYNQTAYVQRDLPLIVSVFDAAGMVIAASQTIVPVLPPQGTTPVSFTWNEPFSASPARIEVVVVPMLPRVLP